MSFPRYPKYNVSGVEWLGQVPEHWKVVPFKAILAVTITDGPHEGTLHPAAGAVVS